VLGASDARQPTNPSQIQFISYTVQKGDTLFDISQKFGISWNTLATLNNLKSPFYLKPGQTLQIPKQ
jgi:LysM repeat protein